ncbi:hypothetical protein [Micromonospora sp. U21]|uniref:hypothetical protein n=1 Tax=Micromonospora sp. U21 TaxID=2824899 RepID=UPI001B3904DD|nr:hypothetical protein [Micromonospora sp. U21]MBQ0906963.1 hypothetical protein [Micromonospora sp. U21]
MQTLISLWKALTQLTAPPLPPAEPAGPAIQEREQAAGRERLLAQARRRRAEHRYDGRAW